MNSKEIEAYFKRINYSAARTPCLEVLNAITEAHTKSIPFENVDVFLNKGIIITDEAIFKKLITNKRGGYCFEQNGLLLSVLETLGFHVKPLAARVRLRYTSREPIAQRTHVFLRVEIEGDSYITDVGMGSASLTQALKLVPDVEQVTPHDKRRIVRVGNIWYHQIWYGNVWQDACEFTLEEMPFIDREVANWYTSAHPTSSFRDKIVASRALDNGERLSIENFDVTLRARNGEAKKTKLNDPMELIEILTKGFGLELTEEDCKEISCKHQKQ